MAASCVHHTNCVKWPGSISHCHPWPIALISTCLISETKYPRWNTSGTSLSLAKSKVSDLHWFTESRSISQNSWKEVDDMLLCIQFNSDDRYLVINCSCQTTSADCTEHSLTRSNKLSTITHTTVIKTLTVPQWVLLSSVCAENCFYFTCCSLLSKCWLSCNQ